MKSAPGDLGERLDVAAASQRCQCIPQLDEARMHRNRGVGLRKPQINTQNEHGLIQSWVRTREL